MHQQVFHLLQAVQVHLSCVLPQPGRLPHVAAAEAEVAAGQVQPLAFLADPLVDEQEQAPGLRRQFVERAAQHFAGERLAVAMSSSVASM